MRPASALITADSSAFPVAPPMINLHGNFIESAQGRSSEELKDLEPQRNRGEVLGEMRVRVKVTSR